MRYGLGLVIALTAFWLLNSGFFKPLMLSLGAVSVLVTLLLTWRLGILDRDSSYYHRSLGLLGYIPWLLWEIAKSNVAVVRAAIASEINLSPVMVKVPTRCTTDLAKTLFANSITLTPGTVTVDVERDKLLIHALFASGGEVSGFDEMDRRSARAIDGRAAG
jgi:multicomponent Na+:H+ antiporter subunit E